MKKVKRIYNEDQKQAYMDYEIKNAYSLRNYFKRTFEKEHQYKKDIADMNTAELIDTLTNMGIRREESRSHAISLFRGYVNWAILNNKTNNSDVINGITAQSIDSNNVIVSKMIKSPEQLNEILSCLDFVNYENRSIRDKLIFKLLYEGIFLEELPLIKKSNIFYGTKSIKLSNDMIKLSNESMDLCKKCSEIIEIERKNGRATASKNKNSDEFSSSVLVNNSYLFRPIRGEKRMDSDDEMFSINSMNAIVSRVCMDGIGENSRLSPNNITTSGIFYKLVLLEQSGKEIDLETIANQFRIKYSNKEELFSKTRKLRIDYEDWKLAFKYM